MRLAALDARAALGRAASGSVLADVADGLVAVVVVTAALARHLVREAAGRCPPRSPGRVPVLPRAATRAGGVR